MQVMKAFPLIGYVVYKRNQPRSLPTDEQVEIRKMVGLFSDVAVLIKTSGQNSAWQLGRIQRMRKGTLDYTKPVIVDDVEHQNIDIIMLMYESFDEDGKTLYKYSTSKKEFIIISCTIYFLVFSYMYPLMEIQSIACVQLIKTISIKLFKNKIRPFRHLVEVHENDNMWIWQMMGLMFYWFNLSQTIMRPMYGGRQEPESREFMSVLKFVCFLVGYLCNDLNTVI